MSFQHAHRLETKLIVGLALTCLTVGGLALASSQSDGSLNFYAPFDGTVTASFSRVGSGVPVTAQGYQFTEGICSQAVHMGEACELEYDGTGLFQPEGGTVMFWVRPDWDGYFSEIDQSNIYSLFQAQAGTDNRIYLFMWNWLRCDFKDAALEAPISLEQRCRFAWMRGDWWHVAMTWERGTNACLYVNGVLSEKQANLNLADIQRFIMGPSNPNAAFDEFRILGRSLSPPEVMENYRCYAPWDFVLERRYLRADLPEQLALELAPGQGSPATLSGSLKLRVLADSDMRVVMETTNSFSGSDSRQTVTVPLSGLPEGAYRLECALTTPRGRWQRSFPVTLYSQREAPVSSLNEVAKGDGVASIDCAEEGNGFIAGAPTQVKNLTNGAAYREAGSNKWDRFAYEVGILGADGSPVMLEVTWPDDRERAMGLYMIVEAASPQHRDRLAGGIQCGGEYPNSGAMRTTRYLFYPSAEKYLFEVRTLIPGMPAAVAKLDIYRLAERLPKLAVTAPAGMPARTLGHLDEDQSFEILIASQDSRFPKSPLPYGYPIQVMERLLDYFDYTGQKGMSYPLARYYYSYLDHGPINNIDTSMRSTGWVLLMLDMMERRGQQLAGSINLWTVPLPDGFTTGLAVRVAQDYYSRDRDGKPMVPGEAPLSGIGSESVGLGNNPLHPVVRAQFLDLINEILRRYGRHPAFAGIDLWCAPYSPFLFKSLDQGYDDLTVSQFEQDTGINVPSAQDDSRFATRYAYLTGPKRADWLAWRVGKTTDLLKDVDQALQSCRNDLRLNISVNGWYDSSPLFLAKNRSENFYFDMWAYEHLGLDMNALKQMPSVVLTPQKDGTFYRWIKHWRGNENITTELNWNVDKFRVFRNAGRNATAIYLRYFESFMPSLKQDVYPGYFQNADPKAHGRYFLQDFAVALASQDPDRINVGAQPIGTTGRDTEAREFALAYGALPAVEFSDVPGLMDPVTVRYAHTLNGTYLYAVSLLGSALTLDLSLPADAGTVKDLSGGTPVQVTNQCLSIELQPFQLRSFLLSNQQAGPFSGYVTVPEATCAMYTAKAAELAATLVQLQGNGMDVAKQAERLAVINQRLTQDAYAEAHRLIFSKLMRDVIVSAQDTNVIANVTTVVSNGSFEIGISNPPGWSFWGGTNTISGAYLTNGGQQVHSGTKAVSIVIPASADSAAYAMWLSDPIEVEPGAAYSVKAWIKTSGCAGMGAWMWIIEYTEKYGETKGAGEIADMQFFSGTRDWRAWSASILIASDIHWLRIACRLDGTGTASFDELMVLKADDDYEWIELEAPAALAATMVTSNNFAANWGAVSTATNYFVDVSSVNSFSSYLGGFSNFVAGNVLSCTVTGVSTGNTYFYRVRAQNSEMTGANSETISVTIGAVATHYVVPPGTSGVKPADPYATWATAGTSIVDVVNAAMTNAIPRLVLVTNGTYFLTNQIVIATDMTLRSFHAGSLDVAGTVINGNYPNTTNRCMLFSNAVVVIDGFTITNGYANASSTLGGDGGGIYVYNSYGNGDVRAGGMVTNCLIAGNQAAGTYGGGLYLNCVAVTVACSRVAGNLATNGYGGGLGEYFCRGVISNCSFNNNCASGGGGLYLYRWNILLRNCTVASNSAVAAGGIHATAEAQIQGCVIVSNVAYGVSREAGGANLVSGATMWDCLVISNTATYGGGISVGDGSVVSNCLLRHNYGWIGTIFIGGGLVVNSMITSNYGQGIGGVFSYGGTVRNCLIANNVGNAIQQQNEGSGGGYFQNCTVVSNGAGINFLVRAHIENCIVYDNASGNYNAGGIWTNSCTTPMPAGTYDTNNITNAPAFADKAAGIFRLSAASPCIDRGIYRKWMTNAVDLDGRTRIRYGTVDMGAYEYIGNGTLFRAW